MTEKIKKMRHLNKKGTNCLKPAVIVVIKNHCTACTQSSSHFASKTIFYTHFNKLWIFTIKSMLTGGPHDLISRD